MTRNARTGVLGIGLLIGCIIWLTLRVSGLFRAGSVQLPTWVGWIVALAILTTPLFFTFVESLHWSIRLGAGAIFFVSTFVFPWFYDQMTVSFWIVMLLLYVEGFAVFPLLLKWQKRKRLREGVRGEG